MTKKSPELKKKSIFSQIGETIESIEFTPSTKRLVIRTSFGTSSVILDGKFSKTLFPSPQTESVSIKQFSEVK